MHRSLAPGVSATMVELMTTDMMENAKIRIEKCTPRSFLMYTMLAAVSNVPPMAAPYPMRLFLCD